MRELRIQKLISKHLSLYSSPKFTTGYVKLLRKPPIVFKTGWDILVIFVSTYLMSRCFFMIPQTRQFPTMPAMKSMQCTVAMAMPDD